MKVILDSQQIAQAVDNLAKKVLDDISEGSEIAIIGIRSRGEILAERLAKILSKKLGKNVPCGTLDITLYRDDLNSPHPEGQPFVRTTEIRFGVDNKTIILVDDVLFTGRSTRAALDALIDLGRPKVIKYLVLIERKGRELPIQADYIGHKLDVAEDESVNVNFVESDGIDQVFIRRK